MEKNPKNSEEKDESSENGGENMKIWFQENMRMLVSIVIVVAYRRAAFMPIQSEPSRK